MGEDEVNITKLFRKREYRVGLLEIYPDLKDIIFPTYSYILP
jgi:hypothetical protein